MFLGSDTEIEFVVASKDNDSAAEAGEFLATKMASESFTYMGEKIEYSDASCFIAVDGSCKSSIPPTKEVCVLLVFNFVQQL